MCYNASVSKDDGGQRWGSEENCAQQVGLPEVVQTGGFKITQQTIKGTANGAITARPIPIS